MSESINKALVDFAEAFIDMADEMSQPTYGVFHGGDPRNFSPDPESSTVVELQRHREDCEKWERNEQEGIGQPDCETIFNDDGNLKMHVQRSQYGHGVNHDGKMQTIVHYAKMALKEMGKPTK